MHITITGDLGSGKSSVAKMLCEKLNFKYFSTGNVQRELSKKQGLDTLQMNYLAEKNAEIDKYIDDLTKNINTENKNYILDSRMAWFFIEKSFKIYLTVKVEVAAARVMADKERNSEPSAHDLQEKIDNLNERKIAERKRFNKKYDVDYLDLNNYDLVLDTSFKTIEEVVEIIIDKYKNFQK